MKAEQQNAPDLERSFFKDGIVAVVPGRQPMYQAEIPTLECILSLEKTRGFYVVPVLSQSFYVYFMSSRSLYFYFILLVLFSLFSATSVVRKEQSFFNPI